MKHSILIVDDSPFNLRLLKAQLGKHFTVMFASEPDKALEIAFKEKPTLILMDVVMPGMSGYELCRILKSREDTKNIPVVFLTARGGIEDKIIGLEDVGGDDYITKPYNVNELIARINVHIRLKEARDQLKRLLEEKNQLIKQLEEMSFRDGLTGVYNRKYLEEYLDSSIRESMRYGSPVSVIITDLDHFKQVNDRYGHQVGDQVLRKFTERILNGIRRADILARYGGEEFVIVCKYTGLKGAVMLAEKLRKNVEDQPFRIGDIIIKIASSFGVASTEGKTCISAAQLIGEADQFLYQAKKMGRNAVMFRGSQEEGSRILPVDRSKDKAYRGDGSNIKG